MRDILILSSKFVNSNDMLYKNANKIKPIEGYSDIVCHGEPNRLLIYGMNGEEWSYSAEEAAEMIRNSQEFDGGNIRLIACSTGKGENCIAQKIANILGVSVLAPSEDIYINYSGDMFLTGKKTLAALWNLGEKVMQTGKWIVFNPERSDVE